MAVQVNPDLHKHPLSRTLLGEQLPPLRHDRPVLGRKEAVHGPSQHNANREKQCRTNKMNSARLSPTGAGHLS